MEISHYAFSDESQHNTGRFRSISVVSLPIELYPQIFEALHNVLAESDLKGKELKWNKVKNAKYRFPAIKFIDTIWPLVLEEQLRVDTIIWDTQDSRHEVVGRDDHRNFSIMYYRSLFDCLTKRWPWSTIWGFYPDETKEIDWKKFDEILGYSSKYTFRSDPLGTNKPVLEIPYRIDEVVPKKSTDEPLIQLADLFAGMGAYSCNSFHKLIFAKKELDGQPTLGLFNETDNTEISNSDRERSHVIAHLNGLCKKHKMSVGLKSTHGFRSYDPKESINFWRYQPQGSYDKAPIKE